MAGGKISIDDLFKSNGWIISILRFGTDATCVSFSDFSSSLLLLNRRNLRMVDFTFIVAPLYFRLFSDNVILGDDTILSQDKDLVHLVAFRMLPFSK